MHILIYFGSSLSCPALYF